jgi:hypothetical protein
MPCLFGHSNEETARLVAQGRLFNPTTRRLVEAGITEGMTVLDVGSGVGAACAATAAVLSAAILRAGRRAAMREGEEARGAA